MHRRSMFCAAWKQLWPNHWHGQPEGMPTFSTGGQGGLKKLNGAAISLREFSGYLAQHNR